MSLALKVMLTPLLVAQALRTRARLPRLPEAQGARQGAVGSGPLLRLLIAGDSSAAGVGVARQHDALAGQLPALLAAACGVRVQWRLLAQAGLSTAGTLQLLQRTPQADADLVVVVTGVNDISEQVPSHQAASARDALANWCRNVLGAQHLVFAPLPPVHQMHGLPQPLRWVAGSDARRHDAALQRWAATRSDVSRVDLRVQLNPGVLAHDGVHPGEPVYRQTASEIARHVVRHVWLHLHLAAPRPAPRVAHRRQADTLND